MTIKDFAFLCGCNPKTLRYYDQIGLLKPVRVDEFSGYRHYDEKQALIFVKIKNLQSAGFTIDEIRGLINGGNDAVCRAFEAKIKQQEDRLQRIKEIQRSYLSEMSEMDRKLREIVEHVEKEIAKFDLTEEFGIDNERCAEIVNMVTDFFGQVASGKNGGTIEYTDPDDDCDEASEEEEYLNLINDPDYEAVFEKHGWRNIKDVLTDSVEYFDGGDFAFVVRLVDKEAGIGYAVILLGMLIEKAKTKVKNMSRNLACNVTRSNDGVNHIWVLKKRA